jgi:photosystem II stability/assembly factor-like uncharacterized protein
VNRCLLVVGTKKGLFLLTSPDRTRWELTGPFHTGREINHAIYDVRTGTIFATVNDAWFGCEISRSTDFGKSWQIARQNPAFAADSHYQLERIWHIEPGKLHEPKVLYAGVAPAALFLSRDGGETWSEVSSLTNHPSRSRWQPGAGGLCLHSIAVDPAKQNRMFVGISAVGVFRTDDGGQTWQPANKGTRAEFLPDKFPEFGQCVHKLLLAGDNGSLLFQQNHCGVYRSRNAGADWTEITAGLPSDFGFPLAIHPHQPETLYVIPLQGAEFRCPPGGKLCVYRSGNGGESWEPLDKGLPQRDAYVGVYRESMATDSLDPAGVYFGTNTGKLFGSNDQGDSWRVIADNLPPIYSVSAAVL